MSDPRPTNAASESARHARSGQIGLMVLGAIFLSVNFLFPLLVSGSAPPPHLSGLAVMLVVGVIIAEPAVLLSWLVFGDGSFRYRAILFTLAGAALISAWFLSMSVFFFDEHVSLRRQFFRYDLEWIPLTPVVALAASIPMYFWRLFTGWRLVRNENAPSENNFSIRGVMLFTGVIAALLALAHGTMTAGGARRPADIWIGLGIFSGIAAMFTAMVVVPLLVLTMKTGRFWLRGVIFVGVSGMLINAIGAIVLLATEQRGSMAFSITISLLTVTYFGFSVIMLTYLASLRRLGFRGARRGSK